MPHPAAAPVRKLKLLPLIAATFFMVSGGPYGIEDILGGAGYGWALVLLLLVPMVWSIPTALMVGELASAIPAEGGFYVWVRRSLGPFWGFQEAWLSLAASIFDMAIYPTLFVLYLSRIAPGWTAGGRGVLWALAVVVVCCLLNLSGAFAVGESSVILFVLLLLPFVVLTAAGFAHGLQASHPLAPFRLTRPADFTTALLVAMWNYMGWDNASTVAQEVDNPRRNYPRAIFGAVAIVTLSYVLPIAAMAVAGLPTAQFTTGAWADAAHTLVGPALGLLIVAGGMMNGFGIFNALVLSYSRLPVALAEDGLLPHRFTRFNRKGAPWIAILVCATCWAFALHFTFERLISLDLMLYGASLVLEFVALVVLRRKEPELARPFRIPGGVGTACLTGLLPTALIVYALWSSSAEHLAHMPSLLFGALVACLGPVLYGVARWRRWPASPGRESA